MNQNQYPNIDRYAQKNRQDQELEAMGIDSSEVDFNAPQTYQEFLNQNPAKGTLKIQAFTARQALPVPGVHVIVSKRIGDENHVFFEGTTDESGLIDDITLPAPCEAAPKSPSSRILSRSTIFRQITPPTCSRICDTAQFSRESSPFSP